MTLATNVFSLELLEVSSAEVSTSLELVEPRGVEPLTS